VYEPSVVGVPLRRPAEVSVTPGGSDPDWTDHVAEAGEPCTGFVLVTARAVSVWEYGCPIVPPGTDWF
jgi:hypothetical protein